MKRFTKQYWMAAISFTCAALGILAGHPVRAMMLGLIGLIFFSAAAAQYSEKPRFLAHWLRDNF